MPLRHRCGYAAAFPRSLPGSSCPPPQEFPATLTRGRCAPHPAQIHQVRAGAASRGCHTPVPLVLLSVTLAGPEPSGSTGPSRLCQGCSHPPGTTRFRLPPASPPCCDRISGEGFSPPLEPQRLTAHPRPAALCRLADAGVRCGYRHSVQAARPRIDFNNSRRVWSPGRDGCLGRCERGRQPNCTHSAHT